MIFDWKRMSALFLTGYKKRSLLKTASIEKYDQFVFRLGQLLPASDLRDLAWDAEAPADSLPGHVPNWLSVLSNFVTVVQDWRNRVEVKVLDGLSEFESYPDNYVDVSSRIREAMIRRASERIS